MNRAGRRGATSRVTSPAYNFVFEGDSITANTADGVNWPTVFTALLTAKGGDITKTIKAVATSTMDGANSTPSVASRATAVDALLDPSRDNYLFLLIGYNDSVAQGESLATIQTNIDAYLTARVTSGWKVVSVTHTACWKSNESDRLALDAWLRTKYVRIVEFETNPEIGVQGKWIPPWTSDLTHPAGPGGQVMAKCAAFSWRSFQGMAKLTTVASFTPTTGPAGTSVAIHGVGFTGATAVTVGGTVATSFTVDSDTQITAIVPTTTTGTVSVTSPTGTDTSIITYTFGAVPQATISAISPTTAFPAAIITVTGTNLATTTAVTFTGSGGTRVAASIGNVDSGTQVRVYAPQGAVAGPIVLTTSAAGTAASPDYTPSAAAPVITSTKPTNGSASSALWVGEAVVITGTGLSPTPVSLASSSIGAVTSYNPAPTSLGFTVPTGATSGNLTVTTGNGASNAYAYTIITQPAPAITSLVTASAPVGGNVTVNGYALWGLAPANITVNGTTVTAALVSNVDSQVVFKVPAGATTGKVTITNAYGTVTSATNLTVT